jgi:Tol biopolymer transport system component
VTYGFSPRRPGNPVIIPGPAHRRDRDLEEIDLMRRKLFTLVATILACYPGAVKAADPAVGRLADEVRTRGWIVFSAKSERGDWDLFACRPDGSDRRNITRTPETNEAAPQFSRDGTRLLYRRLPKGEPIDGNHYGTQGELVLAAADGSHPQPLGARGDYPWASWSPDGKQLVCLTRKGIVFLEAATRQVIRTMPRKGFFQQLTWSPDGQWLSGVANSFGAGWSVARMEVATGVATAVSGADCCTPDWFPDCRAIIFSNRPAGQTENNGNGWTQLWMARPGGTDRKLVYGEDGRHVYGGQVSPDGKYVIFTGNMNEDGDPGHSGAPMGLMRLADAPIVGGESRELRKLYAGARRGPVLELPVGWEPSWTSSEIFGAVNTSTAGEVATDPVRELADEVKSKGWIAASARTEGGDWDLFLIRPDGSQRRPITSTREFHEAGVRFSPGGKKILYYRIPRSEAVDNNTYGTYDLVIADADGSHAVEYGRDYPWASWGPDGTRIACLDRRGIRIIDVPSRQEIRKLPRKGIVQQLAWSPDGASFAGTANGLGPFWNIGRLEMGTGTINAVSETERYNCTPDWMPDSRSILYSRGIVPQTGGYAELWTASVDGKTKRLLYAEEVRHLYGGCASPDGKYLLFTRSEVDLGQVDNSRTRMAIIRMADTPMAGGTGDSLAKTYPGARRGPMLDLGWGWEPHWTYAEIPAAVQPIN